MRVLSSLLLCSGPVATVFLFVSTLSCSRLALGYDVDAFGEVTQIAQGACQMLAPWFVAFRKREMLWACSTTHLMYFRWIRVQAKIKALVHQS